MKTVHIVIPCYNEEDRLPRDALLSFVATNPWASVCLINDGSADGTQSLIEQLAAEIPERIEAYGLPDNAGKAEAVSSLRLQIKVCRGKSQRPLPKRCAPRPIAPGAP